MTKKRLMVLATALFTGWAGMAGDNAYLTLDDCEDTATWAASDSTLIRSDDASQGKHSVGVVIDKPADANLKLEGFVRGKVDLSAYDLIAFDYKLTGPADYVDFIIRQFPLNAGRRGNYYPIDQADPRGKWATKIIPLRGPENLSIRLEDFDAKARELYFSIQARPGLKPTVFLVDNVRAMKNAVAVSPVTFGDWHRLGSGDVVYQYSIPVANGGKAVVEARLAPRPGGLDKFKSDIRPERLLVDPGQTGHFNVSITIPAAVAKTSDLYYGEELVADIEAADVKLPTRLIAAVPPAKFVHPSLIGSLEQLRSIPEKIKGDATLEKTWAEVMKTADAAVTKPTPVPDYNGAGPDVCEADNTKLTTLPHRGLHQEYGCPKCGRVYHGELYDSAASGAGGWHGAHIRLGDEVLCAALAYAVTGQEKYGRRAADIMDGYAHKYLSYAMIFPNDAFYPLGPESPSSRRVCGWHFMENRWLQQMSLAFDLLLSTPVLPEADAAKFRADVLRPAVQKTTENEVGLNNIQLPHAIAQVCAGFALEDPTLLYYGINERRGILSNAKHNVQEDGSWAESPCYGAYSASLMAPCLHLLKQAGINPYSEAVLGIYHKPVVLANPDGVLPNFGDGSGPAAKGWGGLAMLPYYDTKRPELAALIHQYPGQTPSGSIEKVFLLAAYDGPAKAPKTDAIKRASVHLDSSGYLALNNDANDLWLAMTFGPHIGHGHSDRLGFELFGGGALQAVDFGAGPYDKYHDFDVCALAHSTMLVDMRDHKPGKGQLLQWQVDGEVKTTAAGCDQLADGVWMERNVAMFPGAVLLVDHLESDTARVYDWAYHNLGEVKRGPKLTDVPPFADNYLYSYLKELKRAEPLRQFSFLFRQTDGPGQKKDTGLNLTQTATPGMELFEATTMHGLNHLMKAATLLSRTQGKTATYITLLEPLRPGQEPTYTLGEPTVAPDGAAVTVSDGKRQWQAQVKFGKLNGGKISIR